jgi:hypothetical protein
MKNLCTIAMLSAVLTLGSQIQTQAATFIYDVSLESSQEVAPNISTSAATGNALGDLTGDPSNWLFRYTVNYSGLEGALRDGHIHLGDRGVNGPVTHFLDFIDNFKGTLAGTIVGDWSAQDVLNANIPGVTPQVVYNNFLAGNYYFNIHSETFRGGEIRGQIEPLVLVPEPSFGLAILTIGGLLLAGNSSKRQASVLAIKNKD